MAKGSGLPGMLDERAIDNDGSWAISTDCGCGGPGTFRNCIHWIILTISLFNYIFFEAYDTVHTNRNSRNEVAYHHIAAAKSLQELKVQFMQRQVF